MLSFSIAKLYIYMFFVQNIRSVLKFCAHGWKLMHTNITLMYANPFHTSENMSLMIFAGSLESANSSILAARRHFKEVVGKKIRILL